VLACGATHPRRAAIIPARESSVQMKVGDGMGVCVNAELEKVEIEKLK
jgi:hypothetical protein